MFKVFFWSLTLLSALAAPQVTATADAASPAQLRFEQFPAAVFRGKTVMPDFRGKQRQFAEVRTRLTAGFRGTPQFAGSLRVIEIGCGTGCVSIYLGDLATGAIYETNLGGEEHSQLSLKHRADSRLLVATWQDDFEGSSCTSEVFQWKDSRLHSGGTRSVKCPN